MAATATLALVLALVPALALALVPATLRVMPLVTSASTQPAQVTFRTQTLIAAQMDFAASQCAPGHQRIRSHALRQQPAVLRATAGLLMLLLLQPQLQQKLHPMTQPQEQPAPWQSSH